MATIWQRIQMAAKAFREGYVTSDLLDSGDYDDFDARKLRYQVLWAMYENTTFRDIHTWAQVLRNQYSLYKEIRNIYSPATRMVEFWKMIIWGGFLSDEAAEEGAIPIRTESEEVREAIKTLWQDSNWAVKKDILVTWGAALGDVALKVVDDPDLREMRLEPVHPGILKDYEVDAKDNVVMYELEEARIQKLENGKQKEVTFREVAELEGDLVRYRTFVDDKPAGWEGQPEEWTEKYGFIPFIVMQHNNVGLPWGWAEIHPGRSKVHEVEDLASKLHDYIRKVVDPVWLFNFKKPRSDSDMQADVANTTSDRPNPAREEMPAIYVPHPQAKAQALVTDEIDVEHVVMTVNNMISELERDFPELQMDIWTVGGYTTGKAMKSARQRVEKKVTQRRPNYDGALIKAHKMAMIIGSKNGYNGYTGFGEELTDDALDHYIPADREIFEVDALEELDKKKKFWDVLVNILSKTQGQIPPEAVLEDFGWSDDRIQKYLRMAEEYKSQVESEMDEGVEDGQEDGFGGSGRESGSGRTGESEDDRSRYQGERGEGRE